jgi:hypothetical protein
MPDGRKLYEIPWEIFACPRETEDEVIAELASHLEECENIASQESPDGGKTRSACGPIAQTRARHP